MRPPFAAGKTPRSSPYILLKSYNVDLEFSGEIWRWRGPAPYYFVTVPEEQSLDLKAVSASVTYGWGMIPVRVRIGDTEWTTSLWPVSSKIPWPIPPELSGVPLRVRGNSRCNSRELPRVTLTADAVTSRRASSG